MDGFEIDLSAFHHVDALRWFLASVPARLDRFDIVEVPAALWPNLYVVDVGSDNALLIRLAGENVRRLFKRDLRGLDLRDIVHGPETAQVLAAYDRAIGAGARTVIRQEVHLRAQRITRTMECAMAPLADETGRVRRIIGFLAAVDASVAGETGIVFGEAAGDASDFTAIVIA